MISFATSTSIGLDISDLSLRIVQLQKRGKKYILITQNTLMLPKGCIVQGDIIKPDIVVKHIKKLVTQAKGKKITSRTVTSVLPESKTFIKRFTIKFPDRASLPEKIAKEIIKHVPYPLEEIYFDWQLLEEFQPNIPLSVLVGAAPMQTVESYVAVIKSAGLLPTVLEIEAASISRALLPISPNSKQQTSGTKILIDLGATRTSLILFDQDTVQFTMSLPLSGEDITAMISKKLKLDYAKAEKAKILCGLDPKKCEGVLKTLLTKEVNRLIDKIQEIISYYNEQRKSPASIQEIILTGGGAYLKNLNTILSKTFRIPVTLGNPLNNIASVHQSAALPQKNLNSFSTAIGLALRGFIENSL